MKCSALLSFVALASAVTAAPSFVSQYENDGYTSLKNNRGGNSIIDRLREKKEFSRFVEVLEKERGLRDELEGDKDLTLFAPTDCAFEELEKQWGSMGGERRPEMKDILRYHVAPNTDISQDCLHAGALIPTGLRLKSLEDRHQRIRVFKFHNEAWLNMKSRVGKEVQADNGRIFPIDRVLMPPSTAGEMISAFPTKFSTFTAALHRTGVAKDVCREHGISVFAPKNEAWENLGLENLRYLFSCVGQETENRGESDREGSGKEVPWCQGTKDLRKIVENHVATKLAYSTDIMDKKTLEMSTLGRQQLTVCAKKTSGGKSDEDREDYRDSDEKNPRHKDVREYNFVINNGEARVQFTDLLSSNGAVHAVDNIMIPKDVRLPHGNRM